MIKLIREWLRHRRLRRYQVGRVLSGFIARDVKREVEVLDTCKLEQGSITARVRTTNILYLRNGIIQQPEWEPEREIAIKDLWHWTGQMWGGLPDGTSLAATLIKNKHDS